MSGSTMSESRIAGRDDALPGEHATRWSLPATATEAARMIRERRSIRTFAKRPVCEKELASLLRLAARTVKLEHDSDALRFVIFAGAEGKREASEAIMAAYSGQGLYRLMPGKLLKAMAERVAKIPVIVAAVQRESADDTANARQLAAVSAIIHSFTLLAWERKLGLVWNTDPVIAHEALTSGIGLAADERLVCLLYIGEFDKLPKGKRRTPASDKWTVLEALREKEDNA